MNSIAARMVFTNAIASMQKAFAREPGFNINNYKLTQSFLRVEQPLQINKSNYLFPIMDNQAAPQIFNTEQRLKLQDSFVVSEVQFFIAQPASAVDTSFRKLTYPNPRIWVSEAGALAVGAIYNGYMVITVNNNVLTPAWDIDRHYLSTETQQTAAIGAVTTLDEYDGKEDGFYPMEPNIVFVGSKGNKVEIQLPTGLSAAPPFSRCGFVFRGILAQNSTVVS